MQQHLCLRLARGWTVRGSKPVRVRFSAPMKILRKQQGRPEGSPTKDTRTHIQRSDMNRTRLACDRIQWRGFSIEGNKSMDCKKSGNFLTGHVTSAYWGICSWNKITDKLVTYWDLNVLSGKPCNNNISYFKECLELAGKSAVTVCADDKISFLT